MPSVPKQAKIKRLAVASTVRDLQGQLRLRGLRSTGPRIAVLMHLQKATSPLSHTEIHEALADLGFDRATIYRNLIDLADTGFLIRSDLGDHVWRFELREAGGKGGEGVHPHFVCIDCGDVSCLPDQAVRVHAAAGTPKALATRQVQVQIKGRCDDCA